MARNVQITRRSRQKKDSLLEEARRHQKKTARCFAVLLSLMVILLGIALYVFVFRSHDVELVRPFSKTDPVFGIEKVSLENSLAPSLASELGVTNEDIPLEGVDITAGAAGLFSEADKEVVYAKSIHEKMYPASITKVMTALVALKYGNPDDLVTVGEESRDIDEGSSVCGIKPGDQLTLRQLLYGLMINSGNDAAMTIAVHVGGTEEQFVAMMNEEAGNIGATGTHFVNAHGLQDENHYTTVYDIYLMFQEALQYEDFRDMISRSGYVATYKNAAGEETEITWESTNHYFINEAVPPEFVTVVGGKTGTTSEAGACLCLYSKDKYGDPYISIILKSDTKETLYQDMNELLSKINK